MTGIYLKNPYAVLSGKGGFLMRSAFVYNFLIEANIMAGIAILLMIPLRKFFRKQLGNSAICFGWLLAAIRLLCPLSLANPLIHAIRSPFAPDLAIRPIAGQVKVRVSDALGGLSDVFRQANNQPAYEMTNRLQNDLDNASVSITLARIWLIGVLLILAWFLFSNIRFRMRLRADRIEPITGELREQYEALCRQRGIKPVPVYFTDPLPSACLVGVFRPYIALPLSASPQDAIHVLAHEICHLRNRDHLWGILRVLCCAVHWFNPLVWAAACMSRTDSELRCDDRVIRRMNQEERKSYAGVLVLAAARKSAPGVGVLATGMTMTGKRLKTRVITVIQHRKPRRSLVIAFAVLSSLCLLCAFATSEIPEQQEPDERFIGDGLYLTETITGTRNIRNESDAIAYARALWEEIRVNDTEGEYTVRQEDKYWFVRMDVDGREVFSALFQDNGVITDIIQDVQDYRWVTVGEYTQSTEMDAQELEEAEAWVNSRLDLLVPGLTGELEKFYLNYVRDVGDAKYVFLSADPKDSNYDAGASVFIRINVDHSYVLLSLQLAGNG